MLQTNVWTVALAALITAIATGLGPIPFALFGKIGRRQLSLFHGAAGGLMLSASHSLLQEGRTFDPSLTLVGVLVGLVLIVLADRYVSQQEDVEVADLEGKGARKALVILGAMTAHSFAEGVGVGVSFGGSNQLGLFITTAIAIHNIPEGIAIGLVLLPRGTPLWKAIGWSIFTSLPQPIMAIPAFLFVMAFKPFLPVGLGLAAGAMIWMVFAELLPDAMEHASAESVATVVVLSFAALLAFQNVVLPSQ